MSPRLIRVSGLLLGSGACALVYQVLWIRALREVFGASLPASAAVLAIFMGGLGVGAHLFGRRAALSVNPLRLYGLLELAVAGGAALSPVLLILVERAYLATGGTNALGPVGATVLRLLLAALVLLPSVVAMGGTLPAAARAVTDDDDDARGGLALLYGANAVGAVVGATLPTFFMIEHFGIRVSVWVAAAVNVVVAVVALRIAAGAPRLAPEPVRERAPPPMSIMVAAFGVGFAFLAAELIWYRMAAPLLGGSTYTFALVLAVALAGIGIGGGLFSWVGRFVISRRTFALTCAAEALVLFAPAAAGDQLALIAHDLRAMAGLSLPSLAAGWVGTLMLLVFPTALVAGFQFPLLVALAGRGRRHVSTDTGSIYASNTLGAIVGSLGAGFVLIPGIGAMASWRLATATLLIIAGAFLIRSLRSEGLSPRATPALVLIATTALCLGADGPSAVWRQSAIGAGRALLPPDPTEREANLRLHRRLYGDVVDGRESAIAHMHANGLGLIVNGKSDGNAIGDAGVSLGLSALSSALHPDPKTAFVIGLASGQTAGMLGQVPGMERVDVIELEPTVLAFTERLGALSFGVLENPRVHIAFGDGRESLITTEDTYDLIVSQPSNPYRAGVSSFFSADFYAAARARLNPGGFLVQWFQAYDVDAEGVALAIGTLRHVFPAVSVWAAGAADYVLIASEKDVRVDVGRIEHCLQTEPWRTYFQRVAGIHDVEGLLARHLAGSWTTLEFETRAGAVNTADRPLLEYSFARLVGSRRHVTLYETWKRAAAIGDDMPQVTGVFDRARVRALRPRASFAGGGPNPGFVVDEPEARAIVEATEAAVVGRFRRAALLARTTRPPAHDGFARLAHAEARAAVSNHPADRAAIEIELRELAPGHPAEVAWIRVLLALGRSTPEELTATVKRALEASREDPWGGFVRVERSLRALKFGVPVEAAAEIAIALTEGGQLMGALAENMRGEVARQLAADGGRFDLCARLYAETEPNAPWDRAELERRAACYESVGHPLAQAARDDVQRFVDTRFVDTAGR